MQAYAFYRINVLKCEAASTWQCDDAPHSKPKAVVFKESIDSEDKHNMPMKLLPA